MSETTQGYLGIDGEIAKVNLGFQSVLNHIRERAHSEYRFESRDCAPLGKFGFRIVCWHL